MDTDRDELLATIARLALEGGHRVAVAESLTGGNLTAALSAAPDASRWLAGGVVAYASSVKFSVLGVTPGPVIRARVARELAAGAARLLAADVAVGTTGCGGPDPEEGQPPGTVYVTVQAAGGVHEEHRVLEGEPAEVLDATIGMTLRMLRSVLEGPAHRIDGKEPTDDRRTG